MNINNKTAPISPEKDRNAISLDLMNRMKLYGMAAAFQESLQSIVAESLTPDAFISFLLAREWDYRSNAAIERLIRNAAFRYKAHPEEIDYNTSRGLNRNQMERLMSLEFIRKGQDLFVTGSAGVGKSYIATAIGYQACKSGIRTLYANASKLFGSLKVAKVRGTYDTEMKKSNAAACSSSTTFSSCHSTARNDTSCSTLSRIVMAASLPSSLPSFLSRYGTML